ncbi:hypothetical protein [uncultured Hymenobacter sp.]|uniref:hypothetical protein n=1 Tax=uncultured Hymenobacter sp. TaxID=170016 RepID=UPI0035CA50B1
MLIPSLTLDDFASLSLSDHLAALRAYRHRLAALRARLALTTDFAEADALSTECGRVHTLSKLHAQRVQELRPRAAQRRATTALLDGFAYLQTAA